MLQSDLMISIYNPMKFHITKKKENDNKAIKHQSQFPASSRIMTLGPIICRLLSSFVECKFSHVFREGNVIVN